MHEPAGSVCLSAVETDAVRPLGVSLPRSSALTDLLLAPSRCSLSSSALCAIRARLIDDIRCVSATSDPKEAIRIVARDLVVSGADPAITLRGETNFVASPVTCRRAIGLAAVARCVRGHSSSPHAAVTDVLESSLEDLATARDHEGAPRPPWWAEWCAGLSASGRAVVQAEAVTWATQLWTSVEWRRLPRLPVVGGRDDWWECPGPVPVVLQGRAEIRVWNPERQVLLVVGPGSPAKNWQTRLAFPALVTCLARGERSAPARVVGFWPSSGHVRSCEVGESIVAEAAEAAVAALRRIVDS
jgi:hypothetical protein